jgi:hypothetical protein
MNAARISIAIGAAFVVAVAGAAVVKHEQTKRAERKATCLALMPVFAERLDLLRDNLTSVQLAHVDSMTELCKNNRDGDCATFNAKQEVDKAFASLDSQDRQAFASYPYANLITQVRDQLRRDYKEIPAWDDKFYVDDAGTHREPNHMRDVAANLARNKGYSICMGL